MRADRALRTDGRPMRGMARAAAGERAPDSPAAAARAALARRGPETGRRDVRGVSGSDGDANGRPRVIPSSRLGAAPPATERALPGGGCGAAALLSGALSAARHALTAFRIPPLTRRQVGRGVLLLPRASREPLL